MNLESKCDEIKKCNDKCIVCSGKRYPQLIEKIHVRRPICGLAHLNDFIYIAHYEDNTIDAFRANYPFLKERNFRVEDLNPVDMAGCKTSLKLFVSDSVNRCMWVIDSVTEKTVDRFLLPDITPSTISLIDQRLLITTSDVNSLYLYDYSSVCSDGFPNLKAAHKLVVKLPHDFSSIAHAVEPSNGSFVVSLRSYKGRRKDGTLIRVDRSGFPEKNTYDTNSKYLFVSQLDDNYILAFRQSEKKLIALHPEHLTICLKLLEIEDSASRIHYAKEQGLLIVGADKIINLYHLK